MAGLVSTSPPTTSRTASPPRITRRDSPLRLRSLPSTSSVKSRSRVVLPPHDMELDAIDEGVVVDRAGVCSASTKRLDVGLSRPSKVLVGDRRERQQVHVVDLDHHGSAPVDASDLYLWSRPEAVGEGDGPVRYSIPKLRAELHTAIVPPDAWCSN